MWLKYFTAKALFEWFVIRYNHRTQTVKIKRFFPASLYRNKIIEFILKWCNAKRNQKITRTKNYPEINIKWQN